MEEEAQKEKLLGQFYQQSYGSYRNPLTHQGQRGFDQTPKVEKVLDLNTLK